MKEIIYIGERYYAESGTAMSAYYTSDWERYDFGRLGIDTRVGHAILIRPATKPELERADNMLAQLMRDSLKVVKKAQ